MENARSCFCLSAALLSDTTWPKYKLTLARRQICFFFAIYIHIYLTFVFISKKKTFCFCQQNQLPFALPVNKEKLYLLTRVQRAFVVFFTHLCEKYNKASCRLVNKKLRFLQASTSINFFRGLSIKNFVFLQASPTKASFYFLC